MTTIIKHIRNQLILNNIETSLIDLNRQKEYLLELIWRLNVQIDKHEKLKKILTGE